MSLHNHINSFRQNLEKLQDCRYSESLEINEEIRANKQVVLTAFAILIDGSKFQIREYIDARYIIEIVSYAYHFQDIRG